MENYEKGNEGLKYWFDGGTRKKNQEGTHVVHVQTNSYRADFDVFRGNFCGFELDPKRFNNKGFGLYEETASFPFNVELVIETPKGIYKSGKVVNQNTQAYVMDNGGIVHRTKVDNLVFHNETCTAILNTYAFVELVFWCDSIYAAYNISSDIPEQITAIYANFKITDTNNNKHYTVYSNDKSEFMWGCFSQNSQKHIGIMPSGKNLLNTYQKADEGGLCLTFNLDEIKIGNCYQPAFRLFTINGEAEKQGQLSYEEELERQSGIYKFEVETIAGVPSKFDGYDEHRGFFIFSMESNDIRLIPSTGYSPRSRARRRPRSPSASIYTSPYARRTWPGRPNAPWPRSRRCSTRWPSMAPSSSSRWTATGSTSSSSSSPASWSTWSPTGRTSPSTLT